MRSASSGKAAELRLTPIVRLPEHVVRRATQAHQQVAKRWHSEVLYAEAALGYAGNVTGTTGCPA